MNDDCLPFDEEVELRPVIGLTKGLPKKDLESLAIDALLEHRQLAAEAETLFDNLPDELRTGSRSGGPDHLKYIKAMIAMHAQMSALSSLLNTLGYIPAISKKRTAVRSK